MTVPQRISCFVDRLIQPIAQQEESYLKDSKDFINFIENTKLPMNTILTSMDVTSLYTNIPQEEGITTVCKAYQDFYKNHLPIPTKFLRRMLCLILKENSFHFFNRRHYLQTHGTAMGTKMAVTFANIFMAKIEKGIISKSKIKQLVWKRYIDDVFCLWDTNEDNIKEFVTRANHYHKGKVQRREIQQRLHPRCANALQTNRDLSIHEFLFLSSTRRKERIHKRRGAAPPKSKFVTLYVQQKHAEFQNVPKEQRIPKWIFRETPFRS